MPIYETTVEAAFSARHAVRMPSGVMENPHSHAWKVLASFRADRLNADGFVIDFIAVMDGLKAIVQGLEGQNLNAVVSGDGAGASAERVAQHLADRLHERLGRSVYSLRVSEAAGCWATYFPDEGPA